MGSARASRRQQPHERQDAHHAENREPDRPLPRRAHGRRGPREPPRRLNLRLPFSFHRCASPALTPAPHSSAPSPLVNAPDVIPASRERGGPARYSRRTSPLTTTQSQPRASGGPRPGGGGRPRPLDRAAPHLTRAEKRLSAPVLASKKHNCTLVPRLSPSCGMPDGDVSSPSVPRRQAAGFLAGCFHPRS